ncbi:MAG TPA: glutamyl-tRNA reductase [Terriglobia bacterium]|jgi:glutamyl-tRNA reductase|nr:glutamyl-tRNA reductase [Terriglobia bacterium]
MQLALVGLSHKTAPVEVRERLAFNNDALRLALKSLVGRQDVTEAMILSTCNRVEVVAESSDDRLIREFLCDFHQISPDDVSKHLYSLRNADAIRHVFRVAASLDSMMVGEPQILGQVKEAYRIAADTGTVGMHLSALMNRAFAVAKKVRSETGISQSAVSISYAAVELARKIFGDLSGKTVMIIGASKMGELTAKHLKRNGVSSVLVTNRTFEHAVELAQVFEGAAVSFEHFTDHMDRADIVISSTGAPHFIISRAVAEQIIHRRKNRPMFFIDIAVPRDIDPTVNEIDNAFLYDIDDLQQVIDENLKERMKEASRAEEIIDSEVQAFCLKIQSREVVPTIVQLRDNVEKIRRDEIERNRRYLKDLSPEQQAAVDHITKSFANKILHTPIEELKRMAHDPDGPHYVDILRRIFNIKPPQ